jgi:hypothetical protein
MAHRHRCVDGSRVAANRIVGAGNQNKDSICGRNGGVRDLHQQMKVWRSQERLHRLGLTRFSVTTQRYGRTAMFDRIFHLLDWRSTHRPAETLTISEARARGLCKSSEPTDRRSPCTVAPPFACLERRSPTRNAAHPRAPTDSHVEPDTERDRGA